MAKGTREPLRGGRVENRARERCEPARNERVELLGGVGAVAGHGLRDAVEPDPRQPIHGAAHTCGIDRATVLELDSRDDIRAEAVLPDRCARELLGGDELDRAWQAFT